MKKQLEQNPFYDNVALRQYMELVSRFDDLLLETDEYSEIPVARITCPNGTGCLGVKHFIGNKAQAPRGLLDSLEDHLTARGWDVDFITKSRKVIEISLREIEESIPIWQNSVKEYVRATLSESMTEEEWESCGDEHLSGLRTILVCNFFEKKFWRNSSPHDWWRGEDWNKKKLNNKNR